MALINECDVIFVVFCNSFVVVHVDLVVEHRRDVLVRAHVLDVRALALRGQLARQVQHCLRVLLALVLRELRQLFQHVLQEVFPHGARRVRVDDLHFQVSAVHRDGLSLLVNFDHLGALDWLLALLRRRSLLLPNGESNNRLGGGRFLSHLALGDR